MLLLRGLSIPFVSDSIVSFDLQNNNFHQQQMSHSLLTGDWMLFTFKMKIPCYLLAVLRSINWISNLVEFWNRSYSILRIRITYISLG